MYIVTCFYKFAEAKCLNFKWLQLLSLSFYIPSVMFWSVQMAVLISGTELKEVELGMYLG